MDAAHSLLGLSTKEVTVPRLLLAALASVILYATAKIIYNIFFHPLRSYPGPFLCRVTPLYYVFCEARGNCHLRVKSWHDKYGEVVRAAPNLLLYNSGRAWMKICGHRTAADGGTFDKDQTFFIESPDGTFGIVAENGDKHRRLRRLMAHAFSEKALKAQETIIQRYVDLFVSQLRNRASAGEEVLDMTRWFNYATFDIIGDLSFGDHFGLLETGVWSKYLASVFGLLQFGTWLRGIKNMFPFSWRWKIVPIITPKKIIGDRIYMNQLAMTKLERRLQTDADRNDFVYYMLRGSKEAIGPDGLSHAEMTAMAETLMLAGSETTATTLSGMLYYLLQTPACLERLKQEIRSSFTSEDQINMNSTFQLPYLHAVLEESLRLYPPVPSALPRITPEPGQIICDKFVPAGTSVALHHYSSYHSSRNFLDADNFHPERWLEGENARFSNDDKNAFHPFSHGPRNCLGKNLAYAELRLLTCKFFWNFDVELQPESFNWLDQKTSILWYKNPLMVKLIPRPVNNGNFESES